MSSLIEEVLAELVAELGGQGLVVGDHKRRLLHLLDDPRDGVCLAGAGRPEQGLEAVAAGDALGQLRDRAGLIAGGLVRG